MFKVNKKLYLAVALVLGLSLSAFAEDATQSTQIPVQSEISQAKAVKLVEIKGNKSISTNTIISKMKTRIGGPYLENVISDDLKRLYLLGFFSDIKIDTEDYKGGIKVIVTLTERPIIESIAFSGIKRIVIREKKLKETLKSKEGQYLDYPTLSEDVATLKSMYEKKGFGQAKVDYTADVDKAANKAKVQFSVVEGKRFKVKAIFVEGNKTFSNVRILKLLKTKKAWLFNPGVLNDEVLAEDMERIKSFYRREGFADLAVDYEVKSDEKKPFLYLTIKVQEGRKYLVGVVSISGNQDTKEREILAKIKECQPGKVFSQDGLKQDLGGIQGLYFDRGYVSAEIEDTTSLNPDTGRVDIAYNITENQIAYVDKIKIRGNARTKDIVIRRELRINPGDRFDGEKLKRSKERLQNLGFFEEVSYDTEDTGTPDKKDLVVEIKEAKTGSFSFGGGYSTVDQFIGFIEVE